MIVKEVDWSRSRRGLGRMPSKLWNSWGSRAVAITDMWFELKAGELDMHKVNQQNFVRAVIFGLRNQMVYDRRLFNKDFTFTEEDDENFNLYDDVTGRSYRRVRM